MKKSAQQRAAISLMGAAGRFRRQARCILEGHGISSSQYNILRILRGAEGVLPIMAIRDRMIDREPSITRLIDRLEEKGLVRRQPSPEDRRRVDCSITAAGLALLDELDDPVDATDRRLMSGLTKTELRTLTELLDRVAVEE